MLCVFVLLSVRPLSSFCRPTHVIGAFRLLEIGMTISSITAMLCLAVFVIVPMASAGVIDCTNDSTCQVEKYECKGNDACAIKCHGTSSCSSATILCAKGQTCTQECHGISSCQGATILCAKGQTCTLECWGISSCQGLKMVQDDNSGGKPTCSEKEGECPQEFPDPEKKKREQELAEKERLAAEARAEAERKEQERLAADAEKERLAAEARAEAERKAVEAKASTVPIGTACSAHSKCSTGQACRRNGEAFQCRRYGPFCLASFHGSPSCFCFLP